MSFIFGPIAGALLLTEEAAAYTGYAAAIMSLGPVAYWRLGESSGTTAANESGFDNGTYVGSPTLGSSGLLTGDSNTAVTLSGSSQYVQVTDSARFDLGDVFTIVVSVRRSSLTGRYEQFVSKGTNSFGFGINPTNIVEFTQQGVGDLAYSTTSILASTTYHLVATKNGSTRKVYVNGADDTSLGTNFTIADNANDLFIGRKGASSTDFFTGVIDEVAIYNYALSSTEVADLYTAATAAASTNAAAGNAAGTGAANQPAATVKPNAGNAAGTGAASGATTSIAGSSGAGSGTGAAGSAGANVAPNAGSGAGTGAAADITTSLGPTATAATGTGAASDAGKTVAVNAGAGAGTGTAYDAAGAVSKEAAAGNAAGTGTAYGITTAIAASIGIATGTGSAPGAQVSTDDTAPADTGLGTGSAGDAGKTVATNAAAATAIAAAYDASGSVAVYAGLASGTGSAYNPTIQIAQDGAGAPTTATGTGTAYDATVSTLAASTGGWAKTVRRGGLPGDHTRPREPQPIVFPVVPAVVAHAGVARGTGSAFDATTTWNDDETALWLLAGLL